MNLYDPSIYTFQILYVHVNPLQLSLSDSFNSVFLRLFTSHQATIPRLAQRQPREHREETWHQHRDVGGQRGRGAVEKAQRSEEETLRSRGSAFRATFSSGGKKPQKMGGGDWATILFFSIEYGNLSIPIDFHILQGS